MLLVSYLFPPIGGGGVPRPLKMAKYLAGLGWEVHVLTVESTYHATKDDTLLNQLPSNVMIHRAKEWNPIHYVRPKATTQSQPASKEVQAGARKKKFITPILSFLKHVKNTLMIPDESVLWYGAASRLGKKIVQENKIPVMFSTSGPNTCHLVARSIKRKTGIHWIADFRDPWTQNMHRSGIPWRDALEERMEKSVMEEADGITTVTRGFADNFLSKYKAEIKDIEVIYNGFDPEDYQTIQDEENYDGLFVLLYTGIFYKERNPRLLLTCVKELIDEGKVDPAHIRLRFAGVFDYPGYSDNRDCVNQLNLKDVVEVMGNLPHQKALSAMKNADVLMLIGDTAPGSGVYIPGKLYEYMAIGRPIFALSLEGESTQIINNYGLGQVANPLNKEEIKKVFMAFYEKWRMDKTAFLQSSIIERGEEGDLSIYNRKFQGKQLSDFMGKFID
ncbi:MAG TPA: glycosyl transferase family 1 [Paenibacillaceae bacterium]|nr:glycosyl transferase family 1 [Paenibacillaceae bacterium]